MKILIVSKIFRDEDACRLREYGHDVNCTREVKAAQRCVNDGYIPDLLYIDNRLDSAQFFAKQIRSKHEAVEIYVIVSNSEASTEDPSRLGIYGFITGDLTVERIVERAGDLRPPEPEVIEEPDPEEELRAPILITPDIASYKSANPEEHIGEDERITITLPRVFKRRASKHVEKGREQMTSETKEKNPKYKTIYRLAFPAILGIFSIAVLLTVYGPKTPAKKAVPVLEDLRGKTFAECSNRLEEAGIPYDVVEVRSEDGNDLIVDQDPPAGTPIEDIEGMTILVSEKSESKDSQANPLDGDDALANEGSGDVASQPPSPAPNSHAKAPSKPSGSKPVVSASASPSSGPSSGVFVTLSASAYDPDGGSIVSYSWSCGGSGPSTSHEFASNVAPSTVTVTVTVTDDEGQKASSSVSIKLI